VSQQSVSQWETGFSAPSPSKLGDLARALGVTPSELLERLDGELAGLSNHSPLVRLRPLSAGPYPARRLGNLPSELSSFIGRHRELTQVKRLLTLSRSVTLTGVAGVGKTRMALRLAHEVASTFPDGVWLVELSSIHDEDMVHEAVFDALGIQDGTSQRPIDVLSDYLVDRRLLLVLDTCEHLVHECAAMAQRLLQAGPGLRVLATSRQPLGISGEQVFVVSPLLVPGPEESAEALRHSEAALLFIERAQAVHLSFAVTASNQHAVAELCRRLEGIPLALELAAVRLPALSVEEILARLDNRLGFLAGGRRGGPPRHQGLRAAIEWSYELCSPGEQLLWARASVFAGELDLSGAVEVCADEDLPAEDIFYLVLGLVDKSILLPRESASGVRYRLLDTLREYGSERLRASGEELTSLRRHRDYYLRLARECAATWCGPDQVEWARRLTSEHTNLRNGLDFCLSDPAEHLAGLDLAATLWPFWLYCGYSREGRNYLERFLALDPEPGPVLTKALWVCAGTAVFHSDLARAKPLLDRCQSYAQDQGDITAAAWTNQYRSHCATFRGDLDGAVALTREAAKLHRQGGDAGNGLLASLNSHGLLLSLLGEFDQGVAVAEESRALSELYGERAMRSYADYIRAWAELGLGKVDAAVAHGREALAFQRLLDDHLGIAMSVDLLASAAGALGEGDRAARLLAIACGVWRQFGLPQLGFPQLVAARERCEAEARQALGDSLYEEVFAEALELDVEKGIGYALGSHEAVGKF
jgi:non-specific serine/threonine protein kinase